ncbi:MAG: hypothetical protein A4E65_02660 [Syntrophorhabdus sp. PtaU1.Bin153]|nr:MAG: hypothetical protein A4E65_02660 [Syntrophorhabdus sp. PtaU1.Bin153]
MLEVDQSAQFALSEDILLKAFPEISQYYAFDTRNGDHFNLNVTAHWVLDRIANGDSFRLLMESFATEFDLKKEDAFKDLAELLEFALENKIITKRFNYEEKESV